MAYPDDYEENKRKCSAHPRGVHNWEKTGHPINRRCILCHKRQWVLIPPDIGDYRTPLNFIPFTSYGK